MKTRLLVSSLALVLSALPINAGDSYLFRIVSTQETRITSITTSGILSWSNKVSDADCFIQWTPFLGGIWLTNDLPGLVRATGHTGQMQVPNLFITGTPSTVIFRSFCETISPVGPPSSIDINADGSTDLTFTRAILTTHDEPPSLEEYVDVCGSEIIVQPFSAGTSIGSDGGVDFVQYPYGVWIASRYNSLGAGGFPSGPWGGVTNAFMPVRFSILGRKHYGWVNIDFMDIPVGGTSNEFWTACRILGSAYQTVPEKGIVAGGMR